MFQTLGQFIVSSALTIAGFFGYHQSFLAGSAATVYAPVPRYESSLALALTATQTSTMSLVSGVDGNGVTLSGPTCFTIDSGVANSVEDVCGTASGTTVSNLIRGVDTSGVTSSSTLARAHRVGADVKITDSPYLAQFSRLLNGVDSFPNALQYSASNTTSSLAGNSLNLASVAYVNATAIAGAPSASTTVPGISLLAQGNQIYNGLDGSPTHYVIPSGLASHVASTSPVVVVASGTLDMSFLSGTSPSFNNVTASSVAVTNGLTANSINASSVLLNGAALSVPILKEVMHSASGTGSVATNGTTTLATTSLSALGTNDVLTIEGEWQVHPSGINSSAIYLQIASTTMNVGNCIATGKQFYYAKITFTELASTSSQVYRCEVQSDTFATSTPIFANGTSSIPFGATTTLSWILQDNNNASGSNATTTFVRAIQTVLN